MRLTEAARVPADPVVAVVPLELAIEPFLLVAEALMSMRPTPFFDGFERATEPFRGALALHHVVAFARFSPVVREP